MGSYENGPESQVFCEDADLEVLCRRSSLAGFLQEIKQMKWNRVNRLYAILVDKIEEIDRQLRQRVGTNSEWERRSMVARSFMEQKRDALLTHINRMRANSISSIMARLDNDVKNIKNSRVMMIQSLINIIQSYVPIDKMKDIDKAVFDTISDVFSFSDYQVVIDSPFTYDIRGNKVMSNSGRDLAYLCPNEVCQEEYGMLFSLSPRMLAILRRSNDLLRDIVHDYDSDSDEKVHNSISCIIDDMKMIVQEFP
jgi:hypothetical protein